MSLLVFEDHRVTQLAPITTSRCAFSILCGGYRLLDWLQRLQVPLSAAARPQFHELLRTDFSQLGEQPAWLLVNARLVPSRNNFQVLRGLLQQKQPCVVRDGPVVAAAVLPQPVDPAQIAAPWDPVEQTADLAASPQHLDLLEYPHDVVHWNLQILRENVEDRIGQGAYQELRPGLFVGADVRIGEHLVCDTSDGPVLVDRAASIGPHGFLSGPAYIGPGTRLIEHAAIKDGCCIGHTVKIGGEVEASVIEPYSNKQHYGFLGHSYLGSWINLGAGTCNSDLKNTYGEINMEYGGRRVASGMQFMGCVIGDYAKSAINTGIFTGKTIGVCSMVYGYVTTNVPSFVNYARLFGQVSELPADVMIATQQRMFRRRHVEQRPCDMQLIRDMYNLTLAERQSAVDQLSL